MMITEKHLDIITTREGGDIANRCRKLLEQVDTERTILKMVFFIDAVPGNFAGLDEAVRDECHEFFGKVQLLVTCIAQKPVGSTLSAEVTYLDGDCTLGYGGDYIVIRHGKSRELVTEGIRFPSAGDTGQQARKVFERIGEILDAEGFKVDEIVRQWNYIEGITFVDSGIQNYQLFNDARSGFYSRAGWTNGYPAATGIGCAAGGVTVSVHAVKDASTCSRPVDNPIQVPAHGYSGKVLASGREAVRTTPKFERARLLEDTVLISGTAAIKGESSSLSIDPARQAETAIEVVEHLVEPSNILPGCRNFRYGYLRVYIKRPEDAEAIVSVLKEHWKDVPMHFLMADICRPELLLEIEGTGTVRRFLECCCTDAGEAREAEAGGAGRIELCEDLPCGGVTPSEENIRQVLSSVSIPVNVLVRPRGCDFVYNEAEILEMEEVVRLCGRLGVNGVVIGALKGDGSVDTVTMKRLMAAAGNMEITFHRAFDECSDPFKALEDIIGLGCDRLLTAGHAGNVNDGALMLKELNGKAAGRIIIMAGSGVRPSNISSLETLAGISEFHSSSHGPDGRTSRKTVSDMVYYPIS